MLSRLPVRVFSGWPVSLSLFFFSFLFSATIYTQSKFIVSPLEWSESFMPMFDVFFPIFIFFFPFSCVIQIQRAIRDASQTAKDANVAPVPKT